MDKNTNNKEVSELVEKQKQALENRFALLKDKTLESFINVVRSFEVDRKSIADEMTELLTYKKTEEGDEKKAE